MLSRLQEGASRSRRRARSSCCPSPKPRPGGRSYTRRRVEIRELLDGRVVVLLDAIVIATAPSPGPDFTLSPLSRPGAARRDPRPSPPRPRVTTALAHLAAAVPRSTRRHPWHYGYDPRRALKAGYVLHDRG